MIVSVFGASSRLGHLFIEQAEAAGVSMRLHYRAKPSDIAPTSATVVVGSLTDPAAVREVLRHADAALVLFGHKVDARVPFCTAATKVIVTAMQGLNQSRLLVVTDAMTGELSGNVGMGAKLMNLFHKRSAHDGMLEDRAEQERLVRGSGFAGWTMIKSAKFIDGPASPNVKAGAGVSIGVGSKITRASLAQTLLQEVQQPQFAQQSIYVAHG
jgi:putative NADH-flavin reductase